MNYNAEDPTLTQDIKFLLLSQKYFFNKQAWIYNSSDLRHFIKETDYTAISLTTYDKYINILNEKFTFPACVDVYPKPSRSKPKSELHTQVFYTHLYTYLTKIGQNLHKKQTISNAQQEHFEKNDNFASQSYNTPNLLPYNYAFEIKQLKMSPSFSPLFVGLIGSLGKEKNWRRFKESVLNIADVFYIDEYKKFSEFYPLYQDNGKALYTYWLDILFPDELFDLTLEIDQRIISTYGTLQFSDEHNLHLLAGYLSDVMFKTRTRQKEYYQYVSDRLNDYLNSPIELSNDFIKTRDKIINFENDIFHRYQSQNTPNNNHIEN